MTSHRPLITMTTDFGYRDGFVGAMKGVIHRIDPEARIVDISHGVPRQDVAAGAVVLRDACPLFPPGTIHLAVVDPGVGSARAPVVVVTDMGIFVGPDNGLFSLVTVRHPVTACYRLDNPAWRLPGVSRTFHGRDIFAPGAAHLSLGAAPGEAGMPHEALATLARPEPHKLDHDIHGHITYRDTFGNLETDIPNDWLPAGARTVLTAGERTIDGPSESFAAVAPGELLFIRGSSGYLEIAANRADAAKILGSDVADKVILTTVT